MRYLVTNSGNRFGNKKVVLPFYLLFILGHTVFFVTLFTNLLHLLPRLFV